MNKKKRGLGFLLSFRLIWNLKKSCLLMAVELRKCSVCLWCCV